MNQSIIDVLLVDDHIFFRNILSRLLEDSIHINVIATAGSGYEALDACHAHRPDVVVMDLNMPMLDGVLTTGEVQHLYPEMNTLILTGMEDHAQAIIAFEAGASGYMRKDSITPGNLIGAIQCVADGGIYIDPAVFSVLLPTWHENEPPPPPPKLVTALSSDERDLLRQVTLGYSNQEIAQKDDVSSKTIANKASMLFSKIEVNGRVQATHFALRHGVIHLDETAV